MRPLPSTPRETLRGSALVFLGATSFGLLAAVIRVAYARGFSPGQVVGAQVALGGVALWLLALAKGAVRAIPWRVAASLVVAGAPSGLTGAFYYGAVHALDS